MNVIGKPYSGKPNVRFDEGAVETDPPEADTAPLLYSTASNNPKNKNIARVPFSERKLGKIKRTCPEFRLSVSEFQTLFQGRIIEP